MIPILENLALGDLGDLENPRKGLASILNVAEEVEVRFCGLKYHKIPLKDGAIIPPERMGEAIRWIQENIDEGKVLVACHYGVGRSASIVIGYLCSIGFKYKDALDFVSSKRSGVTPMPGLEETIKESFNHLMKEKGCTLQ
jgi:protein-tyrosine phosphatase